MSMAQTACGKWKTPAIKCAYMCLMEEGSFNGVFLWKTQCCRKLIRKCKIFLKEKRFFNSKKIKSAVPI